VVGGRSIAVSTKRLFEIRINPNIEIGTKNGYRYQRIRRRLMAATKHEIAGATSETILPSYLTPRFSSLHAIVHIVDGTSRLRGLDCGDPLPELWIGFPCETL
jgi:hypothetical protein